MAGRKPGKPIFWLPRRVLKLRSYAQRGFSQWEAARCLGCTLPAVAQFASKMGIHFNGPAGAPRGNKNRKKYLARKETLRIAAGD